MYLLALQRARKWHWSFFVLNRSELGVGPELEPLGLDIFCSIREKQAFCFPSVIGKILSQRNSLAGGNSPKVKYSRTASLSDGARTLQQKRSDR